MKSALCLILLASGCMANNTLGTAAASEVNVSNISRLSVGMDEMEVLQIMKKPYSEETFLFEEDTYSVWFYVTRMTALGQSRMVPQNLTPLTFKNGVLIGWGFDYYNYLLKKEKGLEIPAPEEEKPDQKEPGVEKVLDTQVQTSCLSLSEVSSPKSSPQGQSDAPSSEEEEEKEPPLNEGDEKMLEEESEQNFDYW